MPNDRRFVIVEDASIGEVVWCVYPTVGLSQVREQVARLNEDAQVAGEPCVYRAYELVEASDA